MKLFKLVVVLSLVLITSACVTGTREIALEVPNVSSETTQSGNVYIASIEDKRTFEQKPKIPEIPSVKGKLVNKTPEELNTYVGRQRNGYGMAMGSVALENGSTVQAEVRKVLENSLQSRGYTLATSPKSARVLDVDIDKFWAWMVPGFISVGFESEVELTLDSGDKSATAKGKGNNEGQVASNANWALTYRRAYEALLIELDSAFEKLGL